MHARRGSVPGEAQWLAGQAGAGERTEDELEGRWSDEEEGDDFTGAEE